MNHEEKKFGVSATWKFVLGFVFTLAGIGLLVLAKTIIENVYRIS